LIEAIEYPNVIFIGNFCHKVQVMECSWPEKLSN
jgi:hypothetical protein